MGDHKTDYIVEKITNMDQLKGIEKEWRRLFSAKKDIPFLFSYDFFYYYFKAVINSFKNVELSILIVKNHYDKIVAIFPFTLEKRRFACFFIYKALSLKDSNLIQAYYFLIDPHEKVGEIFNTLTRFIHSLKGDWDIASIDYIPEGEPLLEECIGNFSNLFKKTEWGSETLVIDCEQAFSEYVRKDMDKRNHEETKRRIRRLNEVGELKLIKIDKADLIRHELEKFYEIEHKNWKGRAKSSLKSKYFGEFYRNVFFHYAEEEKMQLYFLRLNNQYIAGQCVILDRDICYLIRSGYDEDYYKYSPSTVCTFKLFEHLFGVKEIKKIDWYGHYYPYEKRYGKRTRKRYSYTFFNNKIHLQLFWYCKITFLFILDRWRRLNLLRPAIKRVIVFIRNK